VDQREALHSLPSDAASWSRGGRPRLATEESLSGRPAEELRLAMAWPEKAPVGVGIARAERRAGEVRMALVVGTGGTSLG
jgi:hypothetical protein